MQDFRRALDDKSVDALVVATPDHWHCLATIWACQADKDVYVEKPLTLQFLGKAASGRGRPKVPADRAGGHAEPQRPLQHGRQEVHRGRQTRQDPLLPRVQSEAHGAISPPCPTADPPEGFDWDMFNGPAPESPYNANYANNWHHYWRYSGGDMANDGIHQLDLARWLLGVNVSQDGLLDGWPLRHAGVAETPDTQVAIFEFDKLLMTFEMTLYTPYMLKISPSIRQSRHRVPLLAAVRHADRDLRQRGADGRRSARRRLAGVRPSEVAEAGGQGPVEGAFPDPEHKENFVRCVRSRQRPNADMEKGHRSALLTHRPTSATGSAGRNWPSTPRPSKSSATPRRWALTGATYRKP